MSENERVDGVFKNYRGKRRFRVLCPGLERELSVAAPKEEAAIVAAAEVVGRRWQEYEFYVFCEVSEE